MKLRNTTDIPRELILEVIRFVRPPGLSRFSVDVRNTKRKWGGWAWQGFRKCSVKVGKPDFPLYYRPYQYGSQKGKRWWIANRTEVLVILLAHELRHLWQGKATSRRGYAWGARGRYSEVDTEAYALRMLRAWRKRPAI